MKLSRTWPRLSDRQLIFLVSQSVLEPISRVGLSVGLSVQSRWAHEHSSFQTRQMTRLMSSNGAAVAVGPPVATAYTIFCRGLVSEHASDRRTCLSRQNSLSKIASHSFRRARCTLTCLLAPSPIVSFIVGTRIWLSPCLSLSPSPLQHLADLLLMAQYHFCPVVRLSIHPSAPSLLLGHSSRDRTDS